jgi:hypothetical protein
MTPNDMELPEFREAVAEATQLLRGLQAIIPDHVDASLIVYLDRLQEDPVGLKMLRNVVPAK